VNEHLIVKEYINGIFKINNHVHFNTFYGLWNFVRNVVFTHNKPKIKKNNQKHQQDMQRGGTQTL
jgi:hypothetical protein